MELSQSIFEKAKELAPEDQEQVLRFIERLSSRTASGRAQFPAGSFHEAAGRFIMGDLDAPRDLSLATAHLVGF